MPEHPPGLERAEPDAGAAPPSLEDRLRAEAVRVLEREANGPFREPDADQAAVRREGSFEARLLERARNLSIAPELDRAIRRFRSGIGWAVLAGIALALILGAGAARSTMAGVDGTRINFYWVLGGVLGVQTLLLVAWLVVAVRWSVWRKKGRGASPMLGSLGRLLVGAGRWLGEKAESSAAGRAVVRAGGKLVGTGRLGFWTFSSITHAVWLSFNVGALILLVLLLSARQYTFVWETTILAETHYVTMTEALGAPVSQLGFAVPSHEDIVGSQWTGEDPGEAAAVAGADPAERSQRWASLLMASIALYGLAPRLVLLLLALGFRRRAVRLVELDTSLPEYQRLRGALYPATRPLGVVDPDMAEDRRQGVDSTAGAPPPRPTGPPAIVGLEIAPPAVGWPPPLDGVRLEDLGIVESREERARLVEHLESSATEPDPLVIVCELTGTPDRGAGRLLASLRRTVNGSPVVLLTAGQSLRGRGYDADQVQRRVDDWSALAVKAGVDPDSIVATDLDHLTDAMASRLAERLQGEARGDADPARGIEGSFELIVEHAGRWEERGEAPSEKDQLTLHNEIAARYRAASASFRSLLHLSSDHPGDALEEVRTGASRFVDLLPPDLRRSRKWLAAGALAGAFGCVATAAVAGPVALATLPSWSAIGAAVAAALRREDTDSGSTPEGPDALDLSDAARAAALFAVTLELQGHEEGVITRVLDHTFSDDADPGAPGEELEDANAVAEWLAESRHRFDLAVAREIGT